MCYSNEQIYWCWEQGTLRICWRESLWRDEIQIKHRYNKDRKHFHCSQKSLCDLNIHPPLPSSSISFLSLYVSVHFLEFYINRRIRCVLFCLASFTEYSYLSFVNAVYLFLLFLFLTTWKYSDGILLSLNPHVCIYVFTLFLNRN